MRFGWRKVRSPAGAKKGDIFETAITLSRDLQYKILPAETCKKTKAAKNFQLAHIHGCVCVCMCVCVYVVCVYLCVYVCVCMLVCVFVCLCVYVCVCMCA